jgi:uncharacterized protein involved in exopolysaccharide biosynthesis
MSVIDPANRPAQSLDADDDDDIIEIRLSDIVDFLKKSRRQMLLGAILGLVLGGIYAFSKANEYSSQVTVLPELQSKSASGLGNLGSLAGLAGIDIGSMAGGGTDAVRPELYPNVLQSAPFALAIFKQPVYAREYKRTQPLETYLAEKTKSRLPSLFSFGGDEEPATDPADTSRALRLTKEQETLAELLYGRVSGVYDKKTGVLSIGATMPDPNVAADVVRHSLTYLTEYITTYRTEKARREVDFLNKQVSAAKQRYQSAELALSTYRDQNRSVFLNTAKIEEQRIQAEFLLAQDLYNTLSKQAEMAKIKVQENTPVFKVLEPARIPLKKSGPKRSLIMFGAAILGLFGGLVFAFLRRK